MKRPPALKSIFNATATDDGLAYRTGQESQPLVAARGITYRAEPATSLIYAGLEAQGCVDDLPPEVMLAGRHYRRRCGGYYTPLDATPEELEKFFDHVALDYAVNRDTELNERVAVRMVHLILGEARRRTGHLLRALDFGCGSGDLYRALRQLLMREPRYAMPWSLHGCDLSQAMVTASHASGFVSAEKCAYAETPYPREYFDVVCASFVAHYFADLAPFRELLRVLAPGGTLIVVLPIVEDDKIVSYRDRLATAGAADARIQITHWLVEASAIRRRLPVLRYAAPSVRSRRRRSRGA
jgi:SAM-dependent methyltransferase